MQFSKHALGLMACAAAAFSPMAGGQFAAAASEVSSGCSAAGSGGLTFLASSAQPRYQREVTLKAGERLTFELSGSGATGVIYVAAGDGSQAIVAGEAPRSGTFTAPSDGAYTFQYVAGGNVRFAAECSSATETASLTTTSSFLTRRIDRVLAEETSQASLRRRNIAPATPDKALQASTIKDENGDTTQMSVSTSVNALAGSYARAAGKPVEQRRFDAWFDARVSQYEEEVAPGVDKEGRFGMFSFGTDYAVRPGLIIGGLVQLDNLNEEAEKLRASVEGRGSMIGPYASIRLAPDLVLDTRAAWGISDNTAQLADGSSTDFETERKLLRAQLTGTRSLRGFTVSPNVNLAFMEENQISGIGFNEDESASATIGRMGIGTAVSRRVELKNGKFLEPRAALSTQWDVPNFENVSKTFSDATNESGVKAEAGLTFGRPDGLSIEASGMLEGLGNEDFDAWGARLSLKKTLN